jgi:hypothetical protein
MLTKCRKIGDKMNLLKRLIWQLSFRRRAQVQKIRQQVKELEAFPFPVRQGDALH